MRPPSPVLESRLGMLDWIGVGARMGRRDGKFGELCTSLPFASKSFLQQFIVNPEDGEPGSERIFMVREPVVSTVSSILTGSLSTTG